MDLDDGETDDDIDYDDNIDNYDYDEDDDNSGDDGNMSENELYSPGGGATLQVCRGRILATKRYNEL